MYIWQSTDNRASSMIRQVHNKRALFYFYRVADITMLFTIIIITILPLISIVNIKYIIRIIMSNEERYHVFTILLGVIQSATSRHNTNLSIQNYTFSCVVILFESHCCNKRFHPSTIIL